MKRFEYEITRHSADEFKHFIYFCTDHGECNLNGLPSDQLEWLGDLLNDKGSKGWELVQLFLGKDGIVAFWKRALDLSSNQE